MDEGRTEAIASAGSAPCLEGPRTLAGRYRILGLIGRGGSAEVWHANDDRTGHAVAVKMLREDAPAVVRERFLAEARRLDDVRHPNVVRVLGAFADAHRPFLVLDLVEGDRLDHVARTAALSGARVVRIVSQVAAALDAVHARGILHLDVKPGNVIVRPPDDHVTLIDLGIAQDLRVPERDAIGSPAYVAPELIAGEPLSPRSDVYALGLLAFELVRGRPAFASDDHELRARLETEAGTRAVAQLPLRWRGPIGQALARDPEARPASAGGFAQRLRDAVLARPPERATRARMPLRLPRARHLGVAAVLAAAATAVPAGALDRSAIPQSASSPTFQWLARPPEARTAAFALPPPEAYDATLVAASGPVTVRPGAPWQWTAQLRNTGWAGWHRGTLGAQAALGTSDPLDNDEAARLGIDPGNWASSRRPAVQTTEYVGPGQIGWFVVQGRAPREPGSYRIRLRPLIEGRVWLRDVGLTVMLDVSPDARPAHARP